MTHPDRYYTMKNALTAPTCEPRPLKDYLLLPWSVLRYWFADVWWHLWHWYLIVRHWRKRSDRWWHWMVLPGRGRHTDVDPVMCPVCWWAGPVRWLYHGYSQCGEEDVEPMDYCPRCDTEL